MQARSIHQGLAGQLIPHDRLTPGSLGYGSWLVQGRTRWHYASQATTLLTGLTMHCLRGKLWVGTPRSSRLPRYRIWRRELIGVFSLLFREPEHKPWVPGPRVAWENEQYKCHKVEWNWDDWLSGYTIYVAVLLQAQLWKSANPV